MAVKQQVIEEKYALYNGDCCEVMQTIPNESVDFSIYSPPFCGLYNYSSDPRDMSNNDSYQEFFEHYGFLISQIARVTKPGRMTAVHCMDVPGAGNGPTAKMGCGANVGTGLIDFPGDIIREHEKHGFQYCMRRHIWKEPLGVRLRTMAKGLAHRTLTEDSTLCDVATADQLLVFRKKGENQIPVSHPVGLMKYCGERVVPHELQQWRGHTGDQKENRFSHWIWRQYASSFWDDIRIDNVLPYKESKDQDDEKHVHPLQLDVIERSVTLWSNPEEVVLTPFLGVGSEAYGAILNGRKAIGIELKEAYFNQAVKNCREAAMQNAPSDQPELF